MTTQRPSKSQEEHVDVRSPERITMDAARSAYEANRSDDTAATLERAESVWFATPEGQDYLRTEGKHEEAEFYAELAMLEAMARSEDPDDRKQAAISSFDKALLLSLVTDPDAEVSKHAIRRLFEFM